MKTTFFIVLIANLVLLVYGMGFFGVPPSEVGRDPQILNQRNQHAVIIGTP